MHTIYTMFQSMFISLCDRLYQQIIADTAEAAVQSGKANRYYTASGEVRVVTYDLIPLAV